MIYSVNMSLKDYVVSINGQVKFKSFIIDKEIKKISLND